MKTTNRIHRILRVLPGPALALAVLALATTTTFAAGSGTWTNLTSGGLWSTGANWSGGSAASGSGSTAYFNTLDLTADDLVRLDGSYTLTSLVFGDLLSATPGGWFLDDNASAGVNQLNLAGTTPTITVNALGTSKATTIGTVISGSAGLTKNGAGTLILTNAETFTGGLIINGGTLLEDFTSLATATDLINNGNTLTLGNAGILSIKGKASTVTSQALGNVTINAGGGQILGNNNSATSTTITLGTLTPPTIAGSSLLVGYSTGTSGLTITTTSGTLVNGIYSGREVYFNGTANTGYDWATTVSGSSPYTLSGLASGSYTTLPTAATSDALNDVMTANTTLAGAQTHNSLKIGSGLTLATGGFSTTLTSGGLLSVGSSGSTISGAGAITAGNGSGSYDLVIHQFNSGGLTVAASIADNAGNAVSLVKCGSQTLTLNTNANAYTGNTTINAGTLILVDPQNWSVKNNDSALGTSATKTLAIQAGATFQVQRATFTGSQLIMNGGTWQCNNGYGETWNGNVVLNADSFFDATGNGGTTTINGNISGTGGFTRSGPNTTSTFILMLNGVNTYTGPTIVRSSIVRFPTPASMYNSDTTKWVPAYITVASGAGLYLNLGGAGFSAAQAGTILGNLTTGINNNGLRLGSIVTLDTGNGATTLATAINNSTGTGGGAIHIQKAGANALIMTVGNTYTGTTTVNAGTLQAGVATVPGVSGAFGVNSAVTMANSGSTFLALNNFDNSIGSLTGGGSSGGNVTLGTATLTVGTDNTSPAAYAGIISGSGGSLTKVGTGTLILSGANTYTGTTTISNGIVNLNKAEITTTPASGPMGVGGSIVLAGGLLQYTANNAYDYSSRFSTAANQVYNVDTINQPITWGTALISSGGTLTKAGTGTLLLSGANTFTGATTVNGGVLKAGIAANPGVSGAFGLNSAVTLANTAGVALDLAGFDTQIGSLTGGGTTGGNVTNTGAMLTVGGDNTSPAAFAGLIVGTGGKLTKIGTGTLTLNNTDTYSGSTTISGGTLALGASGALPNTASISIAAGAAYDVSLTGTYTPGSTTTLLASGTNLTTGAATLKGGTSVNMAGRSMALTFVPSGTFGDSAHPALVVSQGNLDLTGVAITLTNNSALVLNGGTFVVITNAGGTITGIPTLADGIVYGAGIAALRTASFALSGDGKAVNLVVAAGGTQVTMTLARHAGTGTTNTYGDTLQFDATVSAGTGVVTLHDGGVGGKPLGSAPLTNGACTITAFLNGLTAGVHANIVGQYGGDATHYPTNSTALSPAQSVGPVGVSATGVTGIDKLYDGTTAATLTGDLIGRITGDTSTEVYLVGTGTFNNGGAVGTGIGITSTSTLGGTKASSYFVSTQPTGMTASILGTAVWTNTVPVASWNTAGNWTNHFVGAGADVTADFNQANITVDTTIHLDAPTTVGSLVFGDPVTSSAGSWLFDNNGQSANVLTLAGTNFPCTITVNTLGSGKQVTLSHDIYMATNVAITVGNSPLDLSGAINGSGGLTKNGGGRLTIEGVTGNYYAGPTLINNGTLHVGTITNGVTPDLHSVLGTGPVTMAAGCTLEFDRYTATNALIINGGTLSYVNGWGNLWSGPVALNANVTVNNVYGTTITFSGSITGAGGFTKNGTSTLVLSGDNNYTGTNYVTAGTLQSAAKGLASGGLNISDGGAKVNLAYSGTQYVRFLTLGAVTYTTGNFGATGSGATTIDDNHFLGTGTVTVGVAPLAPVPEITGYTFAGGAPAFTFTTVLGYQYRLVAAEDVSIPLASWQGIVISSPVSDSNGWVTADASGTMTLADPDSTSSHAQRFYRIEVRAQ